MNRGDVRMVEGGEQVRFALQAGKRIRILGKILGDEPGPRVPVSMSPCRQESTCLPTKASTDRLRLNATRTGQLSESGQAQQETA